MGSCLPVSWINFRFVPPWVLASFEAFGEEVLGPTEVVAACLRFGPLLLTVTSCHAVAGGLLMESVAGLGVEHHREFELLAILDCLTALAMFLLMSLS